MPILKKTEVKKERRFGIEFEHIAKWDLGDLKQALRAAGYSLDAGNYSGWQVKHDGSITPQSAYPYGIEMASPPSTLHNYQDFVKVLDIAGKKGAVNTSCGLHVHVHAPELATVVAVHPNKEWMNYIHDSWLNVEKVLFTYMPPSRRSSHYCRPGVAWNTKYQAINFSPLHDDRRTVEFRLHNATLNPRKALAFAALCKGFVEALIRQEKFGKLAPDLKLHTKPQRITTPNGGQFYLQRDKNGKWLIEAAKLKVEMPDLSMAHKELRKELKLDSKVKDYLAAFNYPHYGNAMTELCGLVGVNGMFRGFIEDRYEQMLSKHGASDAKTMQQKLLPDEADFYHEPDYDPRDAEQERAQPRRARPERDDDADLEEYDEADRG